MPPKLSLILPVYNQADHIAKVVRDYATTLEKLGASHEILLVCNGSTDNTNTVCADLAASLPTVRCVTIDERGWGRAVRAGVSAARGELLCYTNAARTQPNDLGRLFKLALCNPNGVTKAVRTVRRSKVRRVGSLLYNELCTRLLDLRANDVNGTPKVFPGRVDSLRALTRNDDLIDLEFMWICRCNNLAVTEVPLHTDERHGGKSTTTWKSAWRLYIGAIRFWYEIRMEKRR
jgi:glycosyltransferase involved in cell wall biosynthesis